MSETQALLVVVEPRLIELTASYVLEPRKREASALNLAEATYQGSLTLARTLERAAGISVRLDRVVAAREQALQSRLAVDAAEYGRIAWSELAWLGASSGSSWHQGSGRSLALLAHPRALHAAPAPKHLQHLARALRYLLGSTAGLSPRLAITGWELGLPAWGGPGLASGCVPLDYTTWMGGLVTGLEWPLRPLVEHYCGKAGAEEWRVTALAAITEAAKRRAHLIELDAGALRASRSTPPPAPEAPLESDIGELRPGARGRAA